MSTFGREHSFRASRLYKADGSVRGCLYFWGRGNNAATLMVDAYWRGAQGDVAEAGIPVVSSDYSSPAHWGDDSAIASVAGARAALNARGAKKDKVLLLAASIGATLALNWARQNRADVAAVALITPVVDIADIHDRNVNGYAAEIEARYGGRASFAAALPTHNPLDYAEELDGLPIRAWYSADDPVCDAGTVETFAARSGVELVSLGAVGHSAGTLRGPDVADFLVGHAA